MIDLHAHTTASDGTHSPSALVQLARRARLKALGITDHDTIDGLLEGLIAGSEWQVDVIPGVELSVDYDGGQFHLLGYYINPGNATLKETLQTLKEHRLNRNHLMIEKLRQVGVSITYEEARKEAGAENVGRPHMAVALVKKKVVRTVQEAFDKYLCDEAPCYVPKMKLSPEQAIGLIHTAQGLAICAHPISLKKGLGKDLKKTLDGFVKLGLDGIETRHTKISPAESLTLQKLADDMGLLQSGGSDFHGDTKPDVKLGFVGGDEKVPITLLREMKKKLATKASAIIPDEEI